MAYWEQLLACEDENVKILAEARRKEKEILSEKREQAAAEQDRMKDEYSERLQEKKKESDAQVKALQDGLKDEQTAKKEKSAEMVLSKKTEIVKMLLDAVLNVPIN